MADLGSFKALFETNPLAAIAGAQLLAISVLFLLLVRSFNARVNQAMRVVEVTTKLSDLCERMVEILEDVRAVQEARARRRAATLESMPAVKKG